ncbi:hypothetical protein MN608_05776 [Microdochium nivale]|nr:hypothetical protein MN608_05776 [Microdochium nivale]
MSRECRGQIQFLPRMVVFGASALDYPHRTHAAPHPSDILHALVCFEIRHRMPLDTRNRTIEGHNGLRKSKKPGTNQTWLRWPFDTTAEGQTHDAISSYPFTRTAQRLLRRRPTIKARACSLAVCAFC